MTELICPKCGKTSGQVEFIEAFCIDCYPIKVKCPRKLEMEQCKHCRRMRIRGEWKDHKDKEIREFVLGKCKGDFSGADYDIETETATFTFTKEGKSVRAKRTIELDILTTMCRDCSRISGGYHQGVVQIRGDPAKVARFAERLHSLLEKKTFITKEEEKHLGVDMQVGSSKAVIGLLSDLKVKATITKKLVGMQEGKRLYRTTFLIRL